jgi:hypothetical protein
MRRISLDERVADKLVMKDNIKIRCEYAMSVADLLKGLKINDSDGDEVYEILQSQRALNYIKKLSWESIKSIPIHASIRVGEVTFIETDSGNWSHAAAYYSVALSGKEDELKEAVNEDTDLLYDWNAEGETGIEDDGVERMKE